MGESGPRRPSAVQVRKQFATSLEILIDDFNLQPGGVDFEQDESSTAAKHPVGDGGHLFTI